MSGSCDGVLEEQDVDMGRQMCEPRTYKETRYRVIYRREDGKLCEAHMSWDELEDRFPMIALPAMFGEVIVKTVDGEYVITVTRYGGGER